MTHGDLTLAAHPPRAARLVGALVLSLGTACGDDPFDADDDSTTATATATEPPGDDDGTTTEPGDDAPPEPIAVWNGPLRRLTRSEYDHTVRDLLGTAAAPGLGFVPDEAGGGYASNLVAPVNDVIVAQYALAAEALAAEAVLDLAALLPCDPFPDAALCAGQFIREFGRRAYRRPLTVDELGRYEALYAAEAAATGFQVAIRQVLEAMLQSPHFLYRVEFGGAPMTGETLEPLAPHELAVRLSYFLWHTTPDDALLDAADAGELATPEQVAARARDMLADPRATDAIDAFHMQWLGLERLTIAFKDPLLFPMFDDELRASMLAETRQFTAHVVLEGDGRLQTLLAADFSFLDQRLAALYGVDLPADLEGGVDGFVEATLPAAERFGVLTQASVMSALARFDATSPVQRGKFVRQMLLCQELGAPPADADLTPPVIELGGTAREALEQRTSSAACSGCHGLMNPLGFAFENYDAIGKFRTEEFGLPIDASGEALGTTTLGGKFTGLADLAPRLAVSAEVQACYATQWFRFASGRLDTVADAPALADIRDRFVAGDADIRELLVSITQTPFFLTKPVARGEI